MSEGELNGSSPLEVQQSRRVSSRCSHIVTITKYEHGMQHWAELDFEGRNSAAAKGDRLGRFDLI